MAQIRQVVSETLQATVRRLLPSQQGFTEDLQASNVITPIIDLTPSAEGDTLPVDLARAIDHSSTSFFVQNATNTVLVNNTGFYLVTFGATVQGNANASLNFNITDGSTAKTVWTVENSGGNIHEYVVSQQLVVFLRSGDSLRASSASVDCVLAGSTRQIADINGNVTLPNGFSSS